MVEAIEKYFLRKISFTQPEEGMFLWVTLPEGLLALKVFEQAIE